jgi:GrpB-like predicted nucleotidyltransferase (UPF0157 family)
VSASANNPIVIAVYDPAWATEFQEEKRRLEEAIGRWAVAVEHVGSTAVPGLAAKPVIDIGVSLRSYRDALPCITPLVKLGYRCMGEYGLPGRIFFRKETDDPLPGQILDGIARTHQVHMYEQGHWEGVAHILFRDWLRTHPETAHEYESLKRDGAARYTDVDEYAKAKSGFIRSVLTQARRESTTPITIADYDPAWPAMYQTERERICAEFGPALVDIEHVGSTSVPGLAAKPIIDIMPGVRTLADADRVVEGMRRLGYEYVPEFEEALPDRRYFRKGHPERKWHVHVVEAGSEFWRRHLAFRDYLRAHPDAAEEYAALKRQLAAQYPRAGAAYTDAKSQFILAIEEKDAAATSPSSRLPERGDSATT